MWCSLDCMNAPKLRKLDQSVKTSVDVVERYQKVGLFGHWTVNKLAPGLWLAICSAVSAWIARGTQPFIKLGYGWPEAILAGGLIAAALFLAAGIVGHVIYLFHRRPSEAALVAEARSAVGALTAELADLREFITSSQERDRTAIERVGKNVADRFRIIQDLERLAELSAAIGQQSEAMAFSQPATISPAEWQLWNGRCTQWNSGLHEWMIAARPYRPDVFAQLPNLNSDDMDMCPVDVAGLNFPATPDAFAYRNFHALRSKFDRYSGELTRQLTDAAYGQRPPTSC
jgi:hypothetical protein